MTKLVEFTHTENASFTDLLLLFVGFLNAKAAFFGVLFLPFDGGAGRLDGKIQRSKTLAERTRLGGQSRKGTFYVRQPAEHVENFTVGLFDIAFVTRNLL